MNESLARISQNYSGDKSAEVDNQETKSNLSPIEKKIQNLEKKLQQIEALRIKLKNGEKLEQTQVSVMINKSFYFLVCSLFVCFDGVICTSLFLCGSTIGLLSGA